MRKSTRCALAALAIYARRMGTAEVREPKPWQASDLITDLLLAFHPDDAASILHRVERDYEAERDSVRPVLRRAD